MNSIDFNKTYSELEEYFKSILDYSLLDHIKESKPTFINISGYPNHENVVSNIYQFFLSDKYHGMGKLFVSALDDCIEGYDISFHDYQVKREVITDNGGRIDLTIEQVESDGSVSKAILIENKIFHTVGNDLNDYYNSFSKVEDKLLILLTLKEVPVNFPFINITHNKWIQKVKQRLGSIISSADLKYLSLLQDFIQQIQFFYEKSIDMDSIKYLFENGEKIDQLKTLESKGANYIAEEIGKSIVATNWEWGRKIPAGLQMPRKELPIYGYIYFNRIFIDHEFTIQIWLKGEKQADVRAEIGTPKSIKELAEKKKIQINDTRDSKGWFNIAEKRYSIANAESIDNIGQIVVDRLENDWEEFTQLISEVYS